MLTDVLSTLVVLILFENKNSTALKSLNLHTVTFANDTIANSQRN